MKLTMRNQETRNNKIFKNLLVMSVSVAGIIGAIVLIHESEGSFGGTILAPFIMLSFSVFMSRVLNKIIIL